MKNFFRKFRQSKASRKVRLLLGQYEKFRLRLQEMPLDDACAKLASQIEAGRPVCAGKLGVTERRIICWEKGIKARRFEGIFPRRLVFSDVAAGRQLSGIFPVTEEIYKKFSHLMTESISQLDMIATMLSPVETLLYNQYCPQAAYSSLHLFEPFRSPKSWSHALAGKKVVVVSPFEDSIYGQYARRDLIWPDKTLPEFHLKVLRYPFFYDGDFGYRDIFQVYDEFCSRIRQLKDEWGAEVVITGCGGLGLPLAAFAKRIGCQGIHMGGATQLLFGIKGKRWDDLPFQNEHWIFPGDTERPETYLNIEGGCYW